MPPAVLRETDLYPPVKLMLEGQGYVVKSEIGAADIVAVRGDEEPVIVELKTKFSLSLFHQAVQRQSLTDAVYVAVPRGEGRPFLKSLAGNKALCRRLGLGLITVRMSDGFVEIHCDPAPYRPRQSKPRKARLLREFARRVGDPNSGGATRVGLVTAYRQDALLCLKILEVNGPTKAADVARQAQRQACAAPDGRRPLRLVRTRRDRHLRSYAEGPHCRHRLCGRTRTARRGDPTGN